MTRAEKIVEAQRLRAEGLLLREIAERMGAGKTTVHTWLDDPDLAKQRARRAGYDIRCVDCGALLTGAAGRGPNAPTRCVQHAGLASRIWTEEAVIVAIQAWAREHGGVPPAAPDWSPNSAHPERTEKFRADNAWPFATTVLSRFGSWNAAIRAAGFDPRLPSSYGRDGDSMALCREIRDRYEAGASSIELADEYDCHPETIRYRVVKAGGRMRSRGRRAAA